MHERGRILTWVGVGTWALVVLLGIGWPPRPLQWMWASCMAAFVAGFFIATYAECPPPKRILLIAVQTLAALGAIAVMPQRVKIEPVLLVIVAAEMAGIPTWAALAWIAAQTTTMVLILRGNIETVLSFLAFEVFAYFAVRIAHSEAEARQELAEANAELKVMAGLLDINSRTEERLRIARELHDLVGHHLAGLSLNLEVARHQASGAAKESIEKSQAITKKLLTDVREVVSRLRADEPIDLTAAVTALRDVITTPALHLEVGDVHVQDSAIAQVALRSVQEIVTNAVRHSGAKNLWLKLASSDHTLEIEARDDGSGTDQIRFGNGLRGIRERVEAVDGTFEVSSMRGGGFAVRVSLPNGSAVAGLRGGRRGSDAPQPRNLATSEPS